MKKQKLLKPPIDTETVTGHTDQDKTERIEAWLRLASVDLPPIKLTALLTRFGYDPVKLLGKEAQPVLAQELTDQQRTRLKQALNVDKAKELEKILSLRIDIITLNDPARYPCRLRAIPDPPPILFVRGEMHADDQFGVAIVGSRRATAYGLSLARQFGRQLASGGLCVVSGGARGVDTEAHLGALEGGGRTICVLARGLDCHYPPENHSLFERVVREGRGVLISEYPPGVEPEPWRFPARNRIISGLSMGVLVIESPVQSGAMITAHQAADHGRDVMAIPGPIDTGLSSGCHRLIQEGARLIQTVEDIFDEIGVLKLAAEPRVSVPSTAVGIRDQATQRPPAPNLNPIQQRIVGLLTLEPKTLDQISESANLSAHEVSSALTLLEMNRLARKIGGQGFVRVL